MVEKRRRTSSFHHSVGFVRLFFGSSMVCVAHDVVPGVVYAVYVADSIGYLAQNSANN